MDILNETEYLVECEKCNNKASCQIVFSAPYKHYREVVQTPYPKKISCLHCGYFKFFLAPEETQEWDLKKRKEYYKFKYWLRTEVNGKPLWANNYNHLKFLISFIEGKIKKNSLSSIDRSKFDYLPTWLQSKKAIVIKELKKLENK